MKMKRIFRSAVTGELGYTMSNPGLSREYLSAGAIMPDDISDIETVVVLDEVLGRTHRRYSLRNMCRSVSMDKLTMRVDVATKFTGHEKVDPMEEADIVKEAYTGVDFDLWKNVVHIVISDEAGKKAAHNLLDLHTSSAARDLVRMENSQIATVAEAGITEKVAGTVYSDWGARTSNVNDTDPFDAIIASMNYIYGQNYEPNFMALHPTLWGLFVRNTWVRELVKAGLVRLGPAGGYFTLPGFPQMRVIVDSSLTATPTASIGPIIGSTDAPGLILGNGPTEAALYRGERAGYDAYIIRQWLEPKVVLDAALDMICT